jgi:ABC-type phosphate/phosphonate transport system substrate-binding protein
MYDFPGTAPALDRLWRHIAGTLRRADIPDVPDSLTRDRPLGVIWRDPGLLLGETCGYPLRTALRDIVRVVATPVRTTPGTDGAWHRSFIVVAVGTAFASLADLRGSRLALNGEDSNSGMNLLRRTLAPIAGGKPFFKSVTVTGAHAVSLAAVATGTADVAAIDCVSFWFLARKSPDLAGRVRVLAETAQSPGLPLITRQSADDAEMPILRDALQAAAVDPDMADVLARLGIRGFTVLPDDAYDVVTRYEAEAIELGYPRLE